MDSHSRASTRWAVVLKKLLQAIKVGGFGWLVVCIAKPEVLRVNRGAAQVGKQVSVQRKTERSVQVLLAFQLHLQDSWPHTDTPIRAHNHSEQRHIQHKYPKEN